MFFDSSVRVFLLSAGRGERLRPFTLTKAKPAIPLLGAALTSYPLALLEGQKVGNLVVNLHHLPETVEQAHWQIGFPCKSMKFVSETELLGSGGGISNAKEHLKGQGQFYVANADEVFIPFHAGVLKDLWKTHVSQRRALATLLVMKHPLVGTVFGGVGAQATGEPGLWKVEKFAKQFTPPIEGFHYLGWMVLSDRIFQYFSPEMKEENILHETLTRAMQNNELVQALEVNGLWYETGKPESFLEATKNLLELFKTGKTQLLSGQKDPGPDGWSYAQQFLQQHIAYYGTGETLIEATDPTLQSKVKNLKSQS